MFLRNLAGVTHRVAELIERLHQLDDQFYNQPNQLQTVHCAEENSIKSTISAPLANAIISYLII